MVISDCFPYMSDGTIYERVCCPVSLASTDSKCEVSEHCRTELRMNYFRLELNTIDILLLYCDSSMYNIICPDVELVGTIRTYSRKLRHDLESDLNKIIKNTAEAHDCTAELEFSPMLPAVINEDPELNEIAQNAALKLFGPEGVKNDMPALMGSEDFALFMEKIPAFFAFIGSRNVEKGLIYTNHNEKYTVDESVLWRGSALTAQFAYDFLNNK